MTVRALVVGSLVMDLAFEVPKRPEPGEVIVATGHGMYRGGKGYNQAVALARMGAQVTFVGAVARDAHGQAFLEALAREGIDPGRVVQLRDSSTALAVPLVTPDGDVGFVQFPGANWQITPAHVADLPDADLLLLQGEIASTTSVRAAQLMRRRGGIVLLNPAPAHDIPRELVELATVVCPNEVEARALVELLGVPGDGVTDGSDGQALASALATGDRAAVVTLGGRGAAWAFAGQTGECPATEVEAVDGTGAGDSFCAALGLRLAEGASYEEAVRFACAAGAFAVTRHGAEPGLPTRAEVERLLDR